MAADKKNLSFTLREPFHKRSYSSDDYSRFAAPDYLDRVSLSHAYLDDHLWDNELSHSIHKRADPLIYKDVREALLNDIYVESSEIEIEVNEGVVFLSGYVENREMKKESEVCIEHISGIVDIFNLLKIYQFKEAGPQGIVKSQARI